MRSMERLGVMSAMVILGLAGGLSGPHPSFAATGVTYFVAHGITGSCASRHLGTIAAALACAHADDPPANNPDTISIARGTYAEHDLVVDANVTIVRQQPTVTIDAQGLGRVFRITSGHTVTLDGLMIEHGTAQFGGGIYNDGTLTIRSSVVTHNTSHATPTTFTLGGGLYDATGNLTVDNSTFSYNVAHDGSVSGGPGGTAAGGGAIYTTNGNPVITGSTFSHNSAIGSTGHLNLTSGPAAEGGAVYSNGGNLLVVSSVFDRNDATGATDLYTPSSGFGGAIFLEWTGSSQTGMTEIDLSTFSNNVAAGDFGMSGIDSLEVAWGGAIMCDSCNRLTLNFDQVVHNRTVLEGSATPAPNADLTEPSEGGGIFDQGGPFTLNGTAVSWNTADAGALGLGGRGGGIFGETRNSTLFASSVDGNVATGPKGQGGGIFWDSGYPLTLTSSAVSGNSVPGAMSDGGGIYKNSTGAVLIDHPGTVVGNFSGGPNGTNNCFPLNGIPNCTG